MNERKFLSWNENFVSPEEAEVIAFGVPLGKDSKKMTGSLRETSWFIESFDPNKGKDALGRIKISDIGDVDLTSPDDIFIQTKKIVDQNKIPLIFGKSHLLTFYALKAFENVKLVSFDAHADIKDFYMDERIAESVEPLRIVDSKRFNCTTWLRRFCELGNEKNVCLVGTRSCDENDYNYIKENRILHFTSNEIKRNLYDVKRRLGDFCKNSNVYISIDIDFFDPFIAPSVEHPEHNGLSFKEFSELIKEISKGKIVGFDLVEIQYLDEKIREITESLAVKVILEVLNLLSR